MQEEAARNEGNNQEGDGGDGIMHKINRIYKHDGVEMTGKEWCKHLGIKPPAFNQRLRRFGVDDPRMFMKKDKLKNKQLKEHAWPARDRERTKSHKNMRGNAEWRALSDGPRG